MEQLDYKNIHLAIIAIEKGAKLMKVPPQNMYMRLKKQGLIHNFLLPYYDELHTQSAEWLAETTVETLKKLGGSVANDNVIDTVEDYENGRITAEQALGQLKYKQVNHQICIRNQQIIDKFLNFVSSYPLI